MAQIDLKERFPLMTPVKSPPALFRINGCGVALYGARDRDTQTGAYVATWCLSLLFVPCLCLRAYRVAKAPSGWYFLGREPLSVFARVWNLILLLAVAGIIIGIQYSAYISSPAYKARQQMVAAQEQVKQNHLTQAARIYQNLVLANSEETSSATQALVALMDNQCPQAPLSESSGVYICAAAVARKAQTIPRADVADKALKLVKDKGDSDPPAALSMLETIRPFIVDTRPIDARRLLLLQKLAIAQPQNLEIIVPLASLLEKQNQLDQAKKLLMPLKDRLGDGEGARVLGTILAREGDDNAAYALLWPYVKSRLDSLHAAEKAAHDTSEQIYEREIELLKTDKGPEDFYNRYSAASGKDEKQAILQQYVDGKVKTDPGFTSTQEELERQSAVVPVALELGIVMLQRAQGQSNVTQRKSELESAEQVFLAIGGIAGESDVYRLSLGQVYYWLGKQVEGRKLFDEFLSSKGRGFDSLMQVAFRLRQLGAIPEARAMGEEAYNKASKPEDQNHAASFRSQCFTDRDDRIAWLNKSDLSNPSIKADLALAIGEKAFEEGLDAEASRQFHIAIDTYATMPRSSSTLNQTALAYYAIFQATGDHQSLDRSMDNFQQAVDLEPTDTILLYNAGVTILDGALADLIGNDIDLHALHQGGQIGLLGFLYRDQASRDALARRVKEHPGIARALSYLEKVVVLSPKNENAYQVIFGIHSFTRNDTALHAFEQRLKSANLNTDDQLTQLKENIAGTKDQKNQIAISASLKRATQQADLLRLKGGRTAAVAICDQVVAMLASDTYTPLPDVQNVIKLAQEAYRISPSARTSGVLGAVYLFSASKDLRRTNPAFEAYCKKYDRSVGTYYLMAVLASEPGAFQNAVVQHPDVQKAIGLIRDESALFPERDSPTEWALLKNADPGEAEKTAEGVRKSPRRLLQQSIATLLEPSSATHALDTYWTMQILKNAEEGRKALRKVAAMGIPLPIEP